MGSNSYQAQSAHRPIPAAIPTTSPVGPPDPKVPIPVANATRTTTANACLVADLSASTYSRTAGGSFPPSLGGNDAKQRRREDTNEHFTYISDPDGNLIELVYHPLGLETSQSAKVSLVNDEETVRWTQQTGFVEEAYKTQPVQSS